MLETEIFSEFDGIIGCNILKPLGAKIYLKENLLVTDKAKIPIIFEDSIQPYDGDDMSYFENIIIDIHFNEPRMEYLNDKLRTDNLNDEEIRELTELICEFKSVFQGEKGENLSSVGKYQHRIPTVINIPVYSRTYRFPQIHSAEVEKQVTEMFNSGIITKSSSSYNAAIWIVPKRQIIPADRNGELLQITGN